MSREGCPRLVCPRAPLAQGVHRRVDVLLVERLDQHEQAELPRTIEHLGQQVARQHAHDEQRATGTMAAQLP